jgi:hypothetical protein
LSGYGTTSGEHSLSPGNAVQRRSHAIVSVALMQINFLLAISMERDATML